MREKDDWNLDVMEKIEIWLSQSPYIFLDKFKQVTYFLKDQYFVSNWGDIKITPTQDQNIKDFEVKQPIEFGSNIISMKLTGSVQWCKEYDEWSVADDYTLDFLEFSDDFIRDYTNSFLLELCDTGGHWFRGQADYRWSCQPSLSRVKSSSENLEEKLRKEYCKQISFLPDLSEIIKDIVRLTFLMQHHGLPTRLLDWSRSPLIALYFAIQNDKSQEDASLWVLDYSGLNHYYAYKEEEHKLESLLSKVCEEDFIFAVHAPYVDLRMKSQQAEFTIFSNFKVSADSFLENDNKILKKYFIPYQIKSFLKKRLENLGINHSTLFPDIDNIAKEIKERLIA